CTSLGQINVTFDDLPPITLNAPLPSSNYRNLIWIKMYADHFAVPKAEPEPELPLVLVPEAEPEPELPLVLLPAGH
ncbi:unnamed protein product, partial [Didymodactylos carnosus]